MLGSVTSNCATTVSAKMLGQFHINILMKKIRFDPKNAKY